MTATFTHSSIKLKKKLGQLFVESHLISEAMLMVALYEQQLFPLRLGEIFVAHGWTEQQTVDFFVNQWSAINREPLRYPIGQYLLAAGLINVAQMEMILQHQQVNGRRFGVNAVQLGLLKQETLDYFLAHLFPQECEPKAEGFLHKQTTIQPCINPYLN